MIRESASNFALRFTDPRRGKWGCTIQIEENLDYFAHMRCTKIYIFPMSYSPWLSYHGLILFAYLCK